MEINKVVGFRGKLHYNVSISLKESEFQQVVESLQKELKSKHRCTNAMTDLHTTDMDGKPVIIRFILEK
jgi:hypothetical protein